MTWILIASALAASLLTGCSVLTGAETTSGQVSAAGDPVMTTLSVPPGTLVEIRLDDALGTGTSHAGDRFTATTLDDVIVDGTLAIPAGAQVAGTVTGAMAAPRGAGNARLTLAFDELTFPDGRSTPIVASLSERSESRKGRTAVTIGGNAAEGALLGRILGRNTRGAVLGSSVGGAVGTAVVVSREGEQVVLPAGTLLTIHLDRPVRVPTTLEFVERRLP